MLLIGVKSVLPPLKHVKKKFANLICKKLNFNKKTLADDVLAPVVISREIPAAHRGVFCISLNSDTVALVTHKRVVPDRSERRAYGPPGLR